MKAVLLAVLSMVRVVARRLVVAVSMILILLFSSHVSVGGKSMPRAVRILKGKRITLLYLICLP